VKDRRTWIAVLGGGALIAAGLGAAITVENGHIEEARGEVTQLGEEIDTSRELVSTTRNLEREVIVLRELAEVIQGILPDEDDVNNLVRTFQRFSEDSDVRIRALKKKPDPRGAQETAFDKVAYTLTLEADAFQFLDFLDMIESHSRFMRVPRFKVTAADRTQVEEDGFASHKVQLDIETFVYDREGSFRPARIEGYDRKRTLMVGEIHRRRGDLVVSAYDYLGARGRRDPWVDPRVPVHGDGETALSVKEQMDVVRDLVARMELAREGWTAVEASTNVVEEMVARADLEQMLAHLEEDLRRVEAEGAIRYVPSRRRLELEVVEGLVALRRDLVATEGGRGPSVEKLAEVLEAMNRHLEREEYRLVLDAFRLVDEELQYIEGDRARRPHAVELRRRADLARTVLEFDEIEIDVGMIAIVSGSRSVALINGNTRQVGDMLGGELLIRDIRTDEIEFLFKGVILARRF
jgi:Tfp pilus assembly protein PilO